MKYSAYTKGLGITGKKLFDNVRVRHGLTQVKDLLMLRIVSEAWGDMLTSRQEITDSDVDDATLAMKNRQAQNRLMAALKQVWWKL